MEADVQPYVQGLVTDFKQAITNLEEVNREVKIRLASAHPPIVDTGAGIGSFASGEAADGGSAPGGTNAKFDPYSSERKASFDPHASSASGAVCMGAMGEGSDASGVAALSCAKLMRPGVSMAPGPPSPPSSSSSSSSSSDSDSSLSDSDSEEESQEGCSQAQGVWSGSDQGGRPGYHPRLPRHCSTSSVDDLRHAECRCCFVRP